MAWIGHRLAGIISEGCWPTGWSLPMSAKFLNSVAVKLRFPSQCIGFLSQCPGLSDAFTSGDADFLSDGPRSQCVYECAISFTRDV
jgi:hypothetical protein